MRTKSLFQLHAAVLLLFSAFAHAQQTASGEEKIYVAVEGEGRIAVFAPAGGGPVGSIDLSTEEHGRHITLAPHNVQVAPDGKTVWATANRAHGEGQHQAASPQGDADKGNTHHAAAAEHQGMPHQAEMPASDEVVVIDPKNDAIIKRIPIAPGAHLAHIVITPDGSAAYATAQNQSAIYKIDARNYRIAGKIQAPTGKQPHGLRIAPDASHAYIALLAGKGLGILNLQTSRLEILPLDGAAVQTAVTPDGKYALASLYDSKKIAVYDIQSKNLRYIDLPNTSRGPVQIYPSPDSRYVYIADQGHYFGQPDGNLVFKADLQQFHIATSIKAGAAPHGIVVDKDARFAYVTNLVGNDLSVIDLQAGKESSRIAVGKEPNGVSIWRKRGGGTP